MHVKIAALGHACKKRVECERDQARRDNWAWISGAIFSALYGPETGVALCPLLEIAVALPLLPRAAKYVDWRRIGLLMVAAVAGTHLDVAVVTLPVHGPALSVTPQQPLYALPTSTSRE